MILLLRRLSENWNNIIRVLFLTDDITSSCLNNNATCYWDWSGEGLEYQVLAGTVFTVIYSIMSVLTGFFADKLPRFNSIIYS